MKITADQLRNLYLEFFKSKGHAVISGASLIPENDPTVLFTTAGMHPLVPYLMGKMPHPAGTRLTDVQKCVRTGDIDEVGDSAHLTFFEMLGNWSLNDYFKKEAISWSFEFLTTKLGFSPDQLSVTVFRGEEGIPADEEAVAIWKSLGIPEERIYRLPREDNWWGPAGETGPCGPDTEMFIDTGKPACGPDCRPGCHCGKFIEIWNDVFMQYQKTEDGKFVPLGRHNVDTGMGVERTICMMNGLDTVYDTDVFAPIMAKIRELSGKASFDTPEDVRSSRVVADRAPRRSSSATRRAASRPATSARTTSCAASSAAPCATRAASASPPASPKRWPRSSSTSTSTSTPSSTRTASACSRSSWPRRRASARRSTRASASSTRPSPASAARTSSWAPRTRPTSPTRRSPASRPSDSTTPTATRSR